MMRKVFNVPSSVAFVDAVAQKFLDEYSDCPLGLSEVLFLLPNRRACQNLKEAFVRAQGLKPTLLPQMMPLGDVEEDELFVSGFDFSEELKNLPPAVPSFRRLLWFTKKIKQDDLAKILSISPSAVGMYERDEREPNDEITLKLAEYFGVSTDYLLGKSDIRNPEEIKNIQFANAGGLDTDGLDEEDMLELQRQIDYIKKMKNKNN